MPFDGSGNYTRVHDWTDDRDAGIKIQASRVDAESDDVASAFNQVFLRTGVVAMSGNFNVGGQKIIGLGSGSAAAPSVIFQSDPLTGLYLNGANKLGFASNGVRRFEVDAAGAEVIGTLDVSGLLAGTNATLSGTLGVTGALTGAAGSFTSLTVAGSAVVTSTNLLAGILGVDGAASGIDADLLDGQQGTYYLPATSYTAADVLAKLLTVDGAGSSLDADLLDGQQGAAYALLAGATFSGALVGNGTLTLNNTNEFSLGLTAATVSTQTTILNMPVAFFDNSSSAAGNGVGLRFRLGDTGGVLRTAGEIASVATAKDASSVTTDMVFLPTATEKMRLTSAGNLGLGTTAPAEKFHVDGAIRADRSGVTTQYIKLSGNAGDNSIVSFSGSGNAKLLNISATTDAVNTTPTTGAVGLIFSVLGTERMRIVQGGNVGIGVIAPAEKLEVSGTSKSNNFKEVVYALSGTTPAIDPGNGGIQTWTLTANSTPTDSLSDGESVTLMVADGAAAYTVTWPSVTWVGGSVPTLPTTGYAVITLWKVSTTLYGSYAGNVA